MVRSKVETNSTNTRRRSTETALLKSARWGELIMQCCEFSSIQARWCVFLRHVLVTPLAEQQVCLSLLSVVSSPPRLGLAGLSRGGNDKRWIVGVYRALAVPGTFDARWGVLLRLICRRWRPPSLLIPLWTEPPLEQALDDGQGHHRFGEIGALRIRRFLRYLFPSIVRETVSSSFAR